MLDFRKLLARAWAVLPAAALVAALPAASLASPRLDSPYLDVPYVQQVKAGCGSAAVAMVIEYWAARFPALNTVASDTEKIDRLLPASSKGIQGSALKQYLESRGFSAFTFNAEWSDLAHHFEKGRPVIVCLAPKGPRAPLHYAVVVGVDPQNVWLNDSARGKLFREDRQRFLEEWKFTGNWALLAVPRLDQ